MENPFDNDDAIHPQTLAIFIKLNWKIVRVINMYKPTHVCRLVLLLLLHILITSRRMQRERKVCPASKCKYQPI